MDIFYLGKWSLIFCYIFFPIALEAKKKKEKKKEEGLGVENHTLNQEKRVIYSFFLFVNHETKMMPGILTPLCQSQRYSCSAIA